MSQLASAGAEAPERSRLYDPVDHGLAYSSPGFSGLARAVPWSADTVRQLGRRPRQVTISCSGSSRRGLNPIGHPPLAAPWRV
jgi:hypothetical protein